MHQPKPHKAKYPMSKTWRAASQRVAAGVPGTQPGDEHDGVQRMYDAIKDAPQTPADRAYAMADAFADSSAHFAAMARATKSTPDEVLAIAEKNLHEFLMELRGSLLDAVHNGVPTD